MMKIIVMMLMTICVVGARVSFMARDLTKDEPDDGETLVFRSVPLNIGAGYNASTGVFTAPRAGTYIFLATLQGRGLRPGDYTVSVNLYKDDKFQQEVLTTADRKNDWDTTSVQNVLRLDIGARVHLRAQDDQNRFDGYFCTFSGVLVTPDV